jgi:mercuric ion transport protein
MAATSRPDSTANQTRLLAGTGLVGALLASSCCVLPLVLFVLGIGGAWMSNLYALMPYKYYFMALSVGAMIGVCVLIRRDQKRSCAIDNPVGNATVVRTIITLLGINIILVMASVLVTVSAMWPLLVPYLP